MILSNAFMQALKSWYHKNECVEQHRVLTASTEKGKEIKNRVSLHYQKICYALEGLVTHCHWCRLHLVQLWKDMI